MIVLVPIGCRSDEGISAPIIKRLGHVLSVMKVNLVPANFKESYNIMEHCLYAWNPDLVLIVGDRIEMTAAACCAFHNHIEIAYFGAGITNNPITTLDDINRHCISMWSNILLCDSKEAVHFCIEHFQFIPDKNIHFVGITNMDDLEVDESLVPDEPYDLVLINPTTLTYEIQAIKEQRKTIYIGPNPDKPLAKSWGYKHTFHNIPRPQFLGLLKNCKRFITNSSSAYYEAPFFLKSKQIIMIGNRNKNRSTPKMLECGASDKITEILYFYLMNKEVK